MNRTLVSLIGLLICLNHSLTAQEIDYSTLSTLPLEQLLEVEISLDDTFDIFDALVEQREVSVATGKKQDTSRAPAITTVITAMDIEAMGVTDLDELLETVPGWHVNRSINWNAPIYTVRGSTLNQGILLLMNGVPIKELWSGDTTNIWAGMPVNNIARIEIVRGPGSAVFGSDAFTGVVNIIPKGKKDMKSTEVGSRIGSFQTKEAWLLHGGEYGKLNFALAAEYRESKDHDRIIEQDAQTLLDRKYGTHASFAPAPMGLDKRNINLSTEVTYDRWQLQAGYEGNYDVDSGIGLFGALDPQGHYNDTRTRINFTYHSPTFPDHWDVKTYLNYLSTRWVSHNIYQYPPGSFGGLYPNGQQAENNIAERHTRFGLTGTYSGFERHSLRLETGYYYGEMYEVAIQRNYDPITALPLPTLVDFSDTPYASVPENSRQSAHISIQDIWTLNSQWELTSGVRYDHYSDFGNTLNPRLALVWQPRTSFTAKLLYGRAFLAPTAIQLYVYVPGRLKGNPNLKPEVINTIELAFDYRPVSTLNLAFNLFDYQITDKILPRIVNGLSSSQNAATWKGRGLELEARWKINTRLSAIGHYSFQDSTDEKDFPLANAPQHQGFLRTDWMMTPNWYLDIRVKWVANRERALGDPRPPIKDYTWTDLTLRYKDIRDGHWNIALGLRNLFDTDAREPSPTNVPNDIPLAGRHYFLELRHSF